MASDDLRARADEAVSEARIFARREDGCTGTDFHHGTGEALTEAADVIVDLVAENQRLREALEEAERGHVDNRMALTLACRQINGQVPGTVELALGFLAAARAVLSPENPEPNEGSNDGDR